MAVSRFRKEREGGGTETTTSAADKTGAPPAGIARWLRYTLPAAVLLALLLAAGLLTYRAWPSEQQEPATGTPQLVSAKTFEEHFGLNVTLLAVTASGGIVDVRFKVLDADKARSALQEDENVPVLNVEGSTITPMMRDTAIQDQDLEVGKTYYILYGNPSGMVKPGTQVSVAIGDLILEPIIAQ